MDRKEYALEVIYSTSKGRDTYGWNIVSLRDNWQAAKKYRTCGGGYDMLGTVFANWLWDHYADRIKANVKPIDYDNENTNGEDRIYGFFKKGDSYWIDGACGFDCMANIARLIGLQIKSNWNKRRKCTDYIFVTDTLTRNEEKALPWHAHNNTPGVCPLFKDGNKANVLKIDLMDKRKHEAIPEENTYNPIFSSTDT